MIQYVKIKQNELSNIFKVARLHYVVYLLYITSRGIMMNNHIVSEGNEEKRKVIEQRF